MSIFKEFPYIIAVDFDGTLCENKWPAVGRPNTKLFEYLIDRQKRGDKIILWTCRDGLELTKALSYCEHEGLIFDAVNENIPEAIEFFKKDPRKIFADKYIDDKCVYWPFNETE